MKSIYLLLSLSLPLAAQKIQPWSGYGVHDLDRPTPPKVEASSIITTPAPADADIIFDGKNTNAFNKEWDIKNGALVASKNGNASTKESYGTCQLHIEWRIPAGRKVVGQKGGNSGIFFMGLYEVQVQESYKNVTYADGQAAALYGQHPPLVNASRPQGEWQSYDITFTAPEYKDGKVVKPATVTILHNGIIVHNAKAYEGPTVFRKIASYPKKHPEKAPLMLQWHSDPVEYRNIWIRELGDYNKKN